MSVRGYIVPPYPGLKKSGALPRQSILAVLAADQAAGLVQHFDLIRKMRENTEREGERERVLRALVLFTCPEVTE
jgi:hypothetical protein